MQIQRTLLLITLSVVIVTVYNNDQSTTIPVILWQNPCIISHFYLYGVIQHVDDTPRLKIDDKVFTNNINTYLILLALQKRS